MQWRLHLYVRVTCQNYILYLVYIYCRVTDCSPHLDGNREWAQQAQYNKFVREWVEELG